ncbi:uncharacterized protein LOC119703210 isoform X2 [Motacilla alba alba]|uniref:uncharacterized protein LOC119703210 isoform X2 n=1 Tax=Motacilla alba alba TaxID=1094192 RepID=UPI0018D51F0D|nr:uncharacterized protein LOC119703210 isoform X2 [Motacilla alba alba]
MQACASGGQNQLMLSSCLLPVIQGDSQVQQLSVSVFQTLMSSVEEEGKEALMTPVCQSLLPLLFHCHDGNQRVAEVRTRGLLLSPWEGAQLPPALAPGSPQPPPGHGTGTRLLCPGLWGHLRVSAALQASRETLLRAVKFLKRKDLEQAVKKEKLSEFAEVLLAEDRSRAAEHLRRALRYLESPQEPLREAAIRFMGMAGRHLRGQQQELQLICSALERLTEDMSSAVSELALQTLHVLRAIQRGRYPILQRLQDQLRRAWKTRPRLSGLGWLHCRSSAES